MTDSRRALPAVNALLADAERAGLLTNTPRTVLVDAIRRTLAHSRRQGGEPPPGGWLPAVAERVATTRRPSLIRVINATGVILHTNLGRAPLPEVARHALAEAAGYSSLEYDVDGGTRGSRQDHLRSLLCDLTGAEDAFVATNAAAALLLALNTLSEGGETLVSRGELLEIGGGFRIPEILRKSGATLVEVGTTNRTHPGDYERGATQATRCALKVHRSNFRMSGYVSEVSVTELVGLMADREVPVVHDAGSGLLIDLEPYGLRGEPLVQQGVAGGATVVFSGDKLVGGPQSGIVVGPSTVVSRVKRNPLARALRPDKSIIAALEATLALYRDRETALADVPTLAMLVARPADLKRRARRLARRIPSASVEPGTSSVGGGSFPDADLPTSLVTIATRSCDDFLTALRRHSPPIIARAREGRVALDVRTLGDEHFKSVAAAVAAARG